MVVSPDREASRDGGVSGSNIAATGNGPRPEGASVSDRYPEWAETAVRARFAEGE